MWVPIWGAEMRKLSGRRETAARVALSALAVFILGCGTNDDEYPDPGSDSRLYGEWINQVSSSSGLGVSFKADRSYSLISILITSTAGTTADAEIENGTYTVAGSTLTFTPREATCPSPIAIWATTFSISGQTLVFHGTSAAVSFLRSTSTGGGSAIVRYGCFENGVLTPHPLAPVAN